MSHDLVHEVVNFTRCDRRVALEVLDTAFLERETIDQHLDVAVQHIAQRVPFGRLSRSERAVLDEEQRDLLPPCGKIYSKPVEIRDITRIERIPRLHQHIPSHVNLRFVDSW